MKMDLIGKTWETVSEKEREELLKVANPVSGIDSNFITQSECVIDFPGYSFSIAGKVFNDEIIIDNDAVFYNSMA